MMRKVSCFVRANVGAKFRLNEVNDGRESSIRDKLFKHALQLFDWWSWCVFKAVEQISVKSEEGLREQC